MQLAPGVTWYVPLPLFRAYLGGFYVGIVGAGPLGVSLGVAWARRFSCSRDWDTWWPEVVAGMSF